MAANLAWMMMIKATAMTAARNGLNHDDSDDKNNDNNFVLVELPVVSVAGGSGSGSMYHNIIPHDNHNNSHKDSLIQ